MAATAFTIYDKAKKKLMDGTIDLDTNVFKGQLHTSASNASTSTISLIGSVTGEVVAGNGYTAGGKSLLSITWAVGASASKYRWDAADMVWTATGGPLNSIKFLVIKNSAGHALCWSRLSTSQFNVTIGNTLTVVFSANGIFELV